MAILGKNLVRNVNMPRARRNSAMSVGACKVARASSLRGSGEIPSALTMWPRNLTESVEIVHLSGLRTTPASARAVCTASRVASWISCVGAKTRMLSMYTTTLGISPRMLTMRCWNTSGALVMPNGRRLKWNQPNGVRNVVKGADSGSRGICQNPEAASRDEK